MGGNRICIAVWMRPLFICFDCCSTSPIKNEVGIKENGRNKSKRWCASRTWYRQWRRVNRTYQKVCEAVEDNVEQVISAVRRAVQAHGKRSALSRSVGETSYNVEQDNTTRIGGNSPTQYQFISPFYFASYMSYRHARGSSRDQDCR